MKTLLFKESVELSVFIIVLMIICKNYNVVFVCCLFLLCILVYLFRVPKRDLPKLNETHILAPCDGTIIDIENTSNDMIKIKIHMNIFDVHVQWYPVEGIIRNVINKKGNFNPNTFFSKSKDNEKISTIIQHKRGIVRVDQIAGQFGQRIVNWSNTNNSVHKGQLMGMIKFSSQVDIFLPAYKVDLLSSVDDKIIGKITPIAKWLK